MRVILLINRIFIRSLSRCRDCFCRLWLFGRNLFGLSDLQENFGKIFIALKLTEENASLQNHMGTRCRKILRQRAPIVFAVKAPVHKQAGRRRQRLFNRLLP